MSGPAFERGSDQPNRPVGQDSRYVVADCYTTGLGPSDLVSADFNGDHVPDVAVTEVEMLQVSLYLGDGNGGLRTLGQSTVAEGPIALDAGDLDGDSKLDLAVASDRDCELTLLFGDGTGHFSRNRRMFIPERLTDVEIIDVSDDGLPDIVVSSHGPVGMFLIRNQDNGEFDSPVKVEAGGGFESLATSTQQLHEPMTIYGMRRDPPTLVVIGRDTHDQLSVRLEVPLGTGYMAFATMSLNDIDDDGWTDVFASGSMCRRGWLVMGAAGGEPKVTSIEYPELLQEAHLVDLGGVGRKDLVAIGASYEELVVIRGYDAADCQVNERLSLDRSSGSIAVVDLNRDGLADFVVTQHPHYLLTILAKPR